MTHALQGLVLLAPAVDITELWWQALSAAEQADARATGFVPLGGGTKVGTLHSIATYHPPCHRPLSACAAHLSATVASGLCFVHMARAGA